MEINELVVALEEQEQNLKSFLDCVVKKQQAIVRNDIDSLRTSLNSEEKLLSEMSEGGKKITGAIENLAVENRLNISKNSLTEFLNSAKDKTSSEITILNHLQNSIKELILKSAFINEQNKILINHSRNFIKETITTLIGLSKGPLLDKKV